ncbi:MAG: hypothetical protein Q9181_002558 [Wetmoreana brouardii]
MDPTKGSQRLDSNQLSAGSAKAKGLWRLGMTSAMSPSMVASTAPSPENSAAIAPLDWAPTMHHSTSTPHMYPGNFGDSEGQSSSRYMSGPTTFMASRDHSVLGTSRIAQGQDANQIAKTGTENNRRTHIMYNADSYGSPNRYVGKSSNPNNEPSARSHRPEPLGFGNVGERLRVNDQQYGTGPKSAPAQVKSFGQLADDGGARERNKNLDDRWLQRAENMYVMTTRRTSIITVSPDEYPLSSSGASNTAALHPSATYSNLLKAQLAIKPFNGAGGRETESFGVQNNGHPRTWASSPVPAADTHDNSTTAASGRGYDTLRLYVETASSGRQHSSVTELENLMTTLIELRGDGDELPSMHRYGRDNVRQYLYQRVFGDRSGSSRLSRENPSTLIEVGGVLVTRKDLHDEIVYFLENQLDSMTEPREISNGTLRAAVLYTNESASAGFSSNSQNCEFGNHGSNARQQQNDITRTGVEQVPTLGIQNYGQADRRPTPIPEFGALNLGGPQEDSNMPPNMEFRQTWAASGLAEAPNLREQQHTQPTFLTAQGLSHGPQGLPSPPYGQPIIGPQQQQYLTMLQQQALQQSAPYIQPQLLNPPGVMPGPYYFPQHAPAVTFIPGRPGIPHTGSMLPYGQQLVPNSGLGMQQLGGPMMPATLMPNAQIATSPFQPLLPSWAFQQPRMPQPATTRYGQLPQHMYQSSSQVAQLPYRPGSDDMFPHSIGGMSVRLQELTRNGNPSFAAATRPEILPFVESARQSRVAEWGVLRIGNIPYALTKQEVYGMLGRNAKIITPDFGVGIHIVMDRPTGKTMDCFVEYFSHGDAQASLNRCLAKGPQLRLGDRIVSIHMSSQDELLKEMFPRAKNCTWTNGRPVIMESDEAYNTGFKTFLTNEELLQMVTHAEKPHRSNYTQKCLQRPYECMISTLAKFPWFAVDRYTMKTRNEMFRQTLNLINLLVNHLSRGENFGVNLSESLLMELLYAGLNAPGFSEQQRWTLHQAARLPESRIRMSKFAVDWPFEVLGRKTGMDEDHVTFYADCLKRNPNNTSTDGHFGTWTAPSNEALGLTTIGQIGSHEREMLLSMLRDVLPNDPQL